jgi:hypothetical protein
MGRLLVDSIDGHRAMDCFPTACWSLPLALGFVDANLAVLGAWLYKEQA